MAFSALCVVRCDFPALRIPSYREKIFRVSTGCEYGLLRSALCALWFFRLRGPPYRSRLIVTAPRLGRERDTVTIDP